MNAVIVYYLDATPAAAQARAQELRAGGARVLIRDAALFDAAQVEACARVECLDAAAHARVAAAYADRAEVVGPPPEPELKRNRK
jgi:hypothetical protein